MDPTSKDATEIIIQANKNERVTHTAKFPVSLSEIDLVVCGVTR